jgi:hypothetical protein
MKDRITRELNYLRFRMLLKVSDNRLLSPAQKELVLAMLKTTTDDVEKERTEIYGIPLNSELT